MMETNLIARLDHLRDHHRKLAMTITKGRSFFLSDNDLIKIKQEKSIVEKEINEVSNLLKEGNEARV
ncbi:MAG: hypothetical protein ABFD07_15400 [Methanobacterium sp.]